MDDLTSKLSEILSDPSAMEQIKGLAGMFTQSQPQTQAPPPAAPVQNDAPMKQAESESGAFNLPGQGDMLQMAMKLMPLLNSFKRDDETTRLLHALRPFLSEARRKKLDEALKLLQIMRLLPMLKSSFLG